MYVYHKSASKSYKAIYAESPDEDACLEGMNALWVRGKPKAYPRVKSPTDAAENAEGDEPISVAFTAVGMLLISVAKVV